MKLLLDTHAFIWWASEPAKLSDKVIELCQSGDNILLLSVTSAWEMQIKMQLRKLRLQRPLQEIIARQQDNNDLQILPILLEHVLELNNLPFHHNDPFDRLLIAQASKENAVLVSKDSVFLNYDVQVMW